MSFTDEVRPLLETHAVADAAFVAAFERDMFRIPEAISLAWDEASKAVGAAYRVEALRIVEAAVAFAYTCPANVQAAFLIDEIRHMKVEDGLACRCCAGGTF